MRRLLTSVMWALCINVLLVFGCTEPKPGPKTCQTTVDCTGGQVCVGGVCGACQADTACGTGQLCLDGLCRLGCKSDDGCKAGERCTQGVCIGGCAEAKVCPAGEVCANGECRPGCATRADCTGDLYCNTAAGACQECLTAEHCKTGFVCDKGVCGCAKENQCAANLCADIQNDTAHCGRCGVVCGLGLCVQATCRLVAQEVSLGATHSCALVSGGNVRCWGSNKFGELGSRELGLQNAPILVAKVSDVKMLSLLGRSFDDGAASTCALHNDGKVSCWGSNAHGQLGTGDTLTVPEPAVIGGLDNVLQLVAGKGTDVDGKPAGFYRCALRSDGTVWCWGSNQHGELGDSTKLSRNLPVQVNTITNVSQIAAGGSHACALLRDGSVWCWGNNQDGQLGIKGPSMGTFAPVDVGDLQDVVSLALGVFHSCAVLKSGRVKCWGRNDEGQLGDGSRISKRTPIEVKGLSDVIAVAAGMWHTCALQRVGKVVCWGRNKLGTLGNGSQTDEILPPTAIATEANVKEVAQLSAGHFHTCAIGKAKGAVWCWGHGDFGQLGNRTTIFSSTPALVVEE